MKKTLLISFLFYCIINTQGQTADSLGESEVGGDDPSQFLTRVELFNDLQYHKNDFFFNQTILRAVVKLGNRFTTRLDLPLIYNSKSANSEFEQFGLGDISFRLLGYRVLESKKSALTASIEFSLNTAQSPLLGTGKNLIVPLLTYTRWFKKNKFLGAITFQQANSISGDETRAKISYSKIQTIIINVWTMKTWSVLIPEWYVDYINGGVSLDIECRFTHAPTKRINIWVQPGIGVFGDFIARYKWNIEVGYRYFFLRNTILKRQKP